MAAVPIWNFGIIHGKLLPLNIKKILRENFEVNTEIPVQELEKFTK